MRRAKQAVIASTAGWAMLATLLALPNLGLVVFLRVVFGWDFVSGFIMYIERSVFTKI